MNVHKHTCSMVHNLNPLSKTLVKTTPEPDVKQTHINKKKEHNTRGVSVREISLLASCLVEVWGHHPHIVLQVLPS
jgi:hypothetical protein